MSRKVCVTAADGNTGFLIAELLLTHPDFKSKVDAVVALTMHPTAAKSKELGQLGATVVPHKPGRMREMVNTLQETGADTICLIPPAHKEKLEISEELANAAKKAGIPNVLLISSAGCDLAERDKQPRLREFIDIETLVLSSKGNPNTSTGHSPCVIR
jgi:DNA-binding NarL/FixJ family response regulator